ncbi:MAG: alpha amylase C-terminal domain-containing protein [Bacteroidota bacterium]
MKKTSQKLALVKDDPWLEPYEDDLEKRLNRFLSQKELITKEAGSLEKFAMAYAYLGLNYDKKKKGWYYREWAPGATGLFLTGEFNNWNRESHPMTKTPGGIWEIFLPDTAYKDRLTHGSLVKVHIRSESGQMDRIPAYIKKVIQDPVSKDFSGQVWEEKPFKWTDTTFSLKTLGAPVIYEAHIGMAQETEGVGTYREFADVNLPRIQALGYNCLQLMAIQEHPYYGSFGYHVSNFFAPTSRFGDPEDLKYLINKAHGMGIAVIMDIVHSHAVKNFAEGLNEFDGTDGQYFHPGGRGYHTSWDSKLFNYGKWEVQQFLLSNVAYWLKEFHFDGYRFDGVTSMLYFHHGDYVTFDHYDKYFKDDVEWDAITYLQLANEVIHQIKPHAIVIAEDMSGMPGLCRKITEGGVGFDYRLGMGLPDYWIKILKHKSDEEWNLNEMWHVMTNRRWKEKTVAYSESHDQALVGDKSIAFWLMDKEMYWHMQVEDDNLIIDRGIALHKMIRMFTGSLGGEGYLNFIGNEFGHPEWVDFPREGNNWSYKYARRQWSLAFNERLKYKYLYAFDKAMVHLFRKNDFLNSLPAQQLNVDDQNKVIVYERNNLIFVCNFHPANAIPDYKFRAHLPGSYEIVLNSDDTEFGGFGRIDNTVKHHTNEDQQLSLYITNRTLLVLEKVASKG